MSTKKITELTDLATPAGADVLPIVDDVAGTPATKKVTATNLMTLAPVQSVAGRTGTVTLSNTDISGLGTAATQDVGTSNGNVVQLDSTGLPAIDGSQLTNLPSTTLSYAAQTYTASGTPLAFTLTSAAQGKVVTVNESNNVYVTIPTGLGSGFNCKFVQLGAGKVVLQAGSGTTLNSYKTGTEIQNTTIGQYAEIELVPVTTDSYVIVGNSATAPFVNTYSVTLDGTNDYVNYGTFSALNSTASFTISAWIKTSTSSRMVFSGGSNDRMSLNATGVQFRVGGTFANIGSGNYDDGNWHQITAVYNAGTVTIYADGNSTADGSSSSYPTSTSSSAYNSFRIGQVANAYYFNGEIDEFAVWSSALSSSEIPDIQSSNAPIDLRSDNGNYTSSSNLINYWRMGDNDGGSGTTVTDLVGSLDGTLTNGASFTADTP